MIYKRLKDERLKLNLTQDELAKKIGMTAPAYALYEQNRRRPDYETLIQLADIFSCSVDYLLGRTNKRDEVLRTPNPGEALVVLAKDADVSEEELRKYIEYLKFRKNNPG